MFLNARSRSKVTPLLVVVVRTLKVVYAEEVFFEFRELTGILEARSGDDRGHRNLGVTGVGQGVEEEVREGAFKESDGGGEGGETGSGHFYGFGGEPAVQAFGDVVVPPRFEVFWPVKFLRKG